MDTSERHGNKETVAKALHLLKQSGTHNGDVSGRQNIHDSESNHGSSGTVMNHPLSDSSPSVTEDAEEASSIYSDSSSKYTDSLPSPSGNARRHRSQYLHPPNDTVEVFRPEEVRWFHRDENDKRWVPFIGYDSLRIETKFRELREYGGSGGAVNEYIIVRGGLFEVDVLGRKCLPIYWTDVNDSKDWKGDRLGRRTSFFRTLNQTSSVIRGSWFRDNNWQPLEEELADQLENEHLAKFEGLPIENTPCLINDTASTRSASPSSNSGDKKEGRKKMGLTCPLDEMLASSILYITAIHTLRFSDCHVDWYSVDDVYLYQDSAALFIRQKLGMQKVGSKLRRGYCYNAVMEDKPPDITHICFVIHGIGQKMRTGAIIKSCADLRDVCNKLKERYFPDLDASNQRVEFLPVEWRSSLRLDGDTVDSITPANMRGLRQLLNSSAMDILYYTSPLYRSEITHGLQTELNRLYSMFCARHPYFEANGGRVSIIAHSLGSVITYDIIMGWNPIQLYDQYVQSAITEQTNDIRGCQEMISELEEARRRVNNLELNLLSLAEKEHMKIPTLSFRRANFPPNFKEGCLWRTIPKLENFFCLGSPMAVFLALRGVRPKGTGTPEHFLPKSVCSRIFNLYHPADPVAYRLEPLVLKAYSSVQAVRIHRYDAMNKPPYSTIPRKPIVTGKKKFNIPPKEESGGGSVPDVREDNFSQIHAERKRMASGDIDQELSIINRDGPEVEEDMDASVMATENLQPPTLSRRLSSWFNRIGNKSTEVANSESTHSSPQTIRRIQSATTTTKTTEMSNMSSAASCSELKELGCSRRDGYYAEDREYNDSVGNRNQELAGGSVELEAALEALNRQCSAPPTLQSNGSGSASVTSTTRMSSPAYSAAEAYSSMLEQTELDYRIDYQLQESRYESSYLSVLTSHTSYWTNQDVAMFILTHLFSDYGPIGIPKSGR